MIGRTAAGRLVVVALLAAGIVAAWRWRSLFAPLGLTELIGGNPAAPLVFLALHIAASLFFVPRTLLALGAGLVFGMWWGIVWAALGSVLGAVAGFLAARYIHSGFAGSGFGGRAWLAKSAGPARLVSLMARADRGGWRMVAMLRLVPLIPHSLTNYVLGLTRLRLGGHLQHPAAGIRRAPAPAQDRQYPLDGRRRRGHRQYRLHPAARERVGDSDPAYGRAARLGNRRAYSPGIAPGSCWVCRRRRRATTGISSDRVSAASPMRLGHSTS